MASTVRFPGEGAEQTSAEFFPNDRSSPGGAVDLDSSADKLVNARLLGAADLEQLGEIHSASRGWRVSAFVPPDPPSSAIAPGYFAPTARVRSVCPTSAIQWPKTPPHFRAVTLLKLCRLVDVRSPFISEESSPSGDHGFPRN